MKTYTLPAYWASALVNNDRTGLNHRERAALDQWLSDNDNPKIIKAKEHAPGWFPGEFSGLHVLDYTAL